MIFKDRADGGQQLAKFLTLYLGKQNTVVLGLPRGGVVTAHEVAHELKLPLDIIVPRKIGAPGNPEFAIGAVTEEGDIISMDLDRIGGDADGLRRYIEREARKERLEAVRRLREYRGERPKLDLTGKTAILVDDGIATGLTMRAAIASARKKGAAKVIAAAPVIAADTLPMLQSETDAVVYVSAPELFGAVGAFYEEFGQVGDEEVVRMLNI